MQILSQEVIEIKTAAVKTAVCGVVGALSLVFMLGGVLFPFATYAAPAASACLLLPIVYEYRQKTAFVMYCAISALAFFIVPDPECVFMFVFVFGLYTVIKFSVDRIKKPFLRFTIKFIYINAMLSAMYGLLIFLFPAIPAVTELYEYTFGFALALIALFNLTFFIYDKAVEKLLILYVRRFRKKIFR